MAELNGFTAFGVAIDKNPELISHSNLNYPNDHIPNPTTFHYPYSPHNSFTTSIIDKHLLIETF